jgi:hypothetical protein
MRCMAFLSVSMLAAYESRTQASSPKADPGTVATCFSCRRKSEKSAESLIVRPCFLPYSADTSGKA